MVSKLGGQCPGREPFTISIGNFLHVIAGSVCSAWIRSTTRAYQTYIRCSDVQPLRNHGTKIGVSRDEGIIEPYGTTRPCSSLEVEAFGNTHAGGYLCGWSQNAYAMSVVAIPLTLGYRNEPLDVPNTWCYDSVRSAGFFCDILVLSPESWRHLPQGPRTLMPLVRAGLEHYEGPKGAPNEPPASGASRERWDRLRYFCGWLLFWW